MKLIVGCPTYKRFDHCIEMIKSAYSQDNTDIPDGMIIVDNSSGQFEQYVGEQNIELPAVVIGQGYNVGVAAAWNAMITLVDLNQPDAWLLIVNDDIQFKPDTIELFRAYCQHIDIQYQINDVENLDPFILCGDGIDAPNAFSMFAVKPTRLMQTIGLFDSTFYPAYYEDNDFYYRMKLMGFDPHRIKGAGADHAGSATLASFTDFERAQHDMRFRRNQHYYLLKWGGMPGEEKFISPFNGHSVVDVAKMLLHHHGF